MDDELRSGARRAGQRQVLDQHVAVALELQAPQRLCAPGVEAEALAQKITLEAHYAHLLVHGTLHAQGYDHEVEAQAQEMEARETAVLAGLGFADPYAR